MHGHLSVKADVFSFGVLVLELISSKRNSSFDLQVDAQNLLEWVRIKYLVKQGIKLVDALLVKTNRWATLIFLFLLFFRFLFFCFFFNISVQSTSCIHDVYFRASKERLFPTWEPSKRHLIVKC